MLNFFVVYFSLLLSIERWFERCVYHWGFIDIRCSVDLYSFSFLLLLGAVSVMVRLWARYYLFEEENYQRFIGLVFFFIVSMVLLIIFSNLFLSFVGWDSLGFTSFLLVIYYKNRKSLGSGIITALINRLGDCLFYCLVGIFLLGEFYLASLLIGVICLTKRAQYPFCAWLPAAMAAPTPVSALVHSSTLVTAGVYLLIRYNCEQSWFLFIGSLTMCVAGLRACVERDFKKIVALRTLSQVRVMLISIGLREKSYCFFHLIIHACFKALLFLCVGIRIHAYFGTQDIRSFNSLSGWPLVFCKVSVFSLMGVTFTSGFYSKDAILEIMQQEGYRSWGVMCFLLGIGLTATYSFKILFLLKPITTSGSCLSCGCSRHIKLPLYAFGLLSVAMGSLVHNFCSVTFISLAEKLPLLLIFVGSLLGLLNGSFVPASSLWGTIPTTQSMSALSKWGGERHKNVDKGWLEMASLTLSPLSSSLVYHYTPALMLLGVLMFL